MIIDSPNLLLQCKRRRRRYLHHSNGKNNICQGINVTEEQYYRCRNVCSPEQACLVRPFIDDLIYKKDNKPNANKEFRMTEKVAVVMGDHEIDLIDAQQDNKERIKKAEIGRKITEMAEDQIFCHPNGTGKQ
jgi:hypothetical protein